MFRDEDRGWFASREFQVFSRWGTFLFGRLGCLIGAIYGSTFSLPSVTRAHALDREDERKARRLRTILGLRRYLVSWEPQRDGLWKARLSGPGLVITIERTAKGRCRAIHRAERAMQRILAARSAIESDRPQREIPPL